MNIVKKLALLGTCLPTFALAQTAHQWKNDFSLGLEVQHYHYKEPTTESDEYWMNSKGYLCGINSSYRLTYSNQFFIQPEGRFLLGKENYQTGRDILLEETKRSTPNLIFEPRLLMGGNVTTLHNRLTFSPYTGLGYRLKIDDGEETNLRNNSTLAYRKSNYVYIPLGASVGYKLSDTWSISAKGEYDYFVKGWQYSRPFRRTPVEFKQRSGYGLKGEVSVSYAYSNKLSFYVSPYIHYWNIKESVIAIDDRQEPKNSTIESGVRFGVSF